MQSKIKTEKAALFLIMVLIIYSILFTVSAYGQDVILDYGIHYLSEEEILVLLEERGLLPESNESRRLELARQVVEIPDSNYDQAEVEKMLGRVANLDLYLLERIKASSVDIYFTHRRITDFPVYSHLKGVVPRGWEGLGRTWDDVPGAGGNPVIVRIGYSEPGAMHGTVNLELHEIGHLVDDYIYQGLSRSDQFRQLWNRERNALFNDSYFIDHSEEYFAETFALYYLSERSRAELKQKAPLTYEFFKEQFNR